MLKLDDKVVFLSDKLSSSKSSCILSICFSGLCKMAIKTKFNK